MCNNERECALIERAVDGDTVALQLLLANSRDSVCQYIAGKVPTALAQHVDADDIVQEAHIEVFRRIDGFVPGGPDSFRRWVSVIALSRLRNAIRYHGAVKRGGGENVVQATARSRSDSTIALLDLLAGPGRTPSRSVARAEAVHAVETALAQLPEQYEQAVRLVHLEGCPVKDAARHLGKTERAVHGLCRRGLDQLRNQLESATNYLSSSG